LKSYLECEWRVCVSSTDALVFFLPVSGYMQSEVHAAAILSVVSYVRLSLSVTHIEKNKYNPDRCVRTLFGR